MQSIGILGGTFDPIHNGHIRLALETQEQLEFDQVRLIPVNIPPHREKPIASTSHRRNMVELAIKDEPRLYLDCRELKNDEISYSINTLKSLREEFVDDSLCLILGRDAFNKLDSWKDWQELLHYAHIIVANRPNESKKNISTVLKNWLEKNITKDRTQLKKNVSGDIYFMTIPELDISSSVIREYYSKEKAADNLLPKTIQTYIKDNHLYQDAE